MRQCQLFSISCNQILTCQFGASINSAVCMIHADREYLFLDDGRDAHNIHRPFEGKHEINMNTYDSTTPNQLKLYHVDLHCNRLDNIHQNAFENRHRTESGFWRSRTSGYTRAKSHLFTYIHIYYDGCQTGNVLACVAAGIWSIAFLAQV